MELSQKITYLRKQKGWSQEQLATKLEVSRQAVYKWEAGISQPEIDKLKNVFRQTHLCGYARNENDAEHSWHMAVMAYLLKEYANDEVDISRVMLMCLIHDIVEIDAGDTYAYDSVGLQSQKEREDAAKERIFSSSSSGSSPETVTILHSCSNAAVSA